MIYNKNLIKPNNGKQAQETIYNLNNMLYRFVEQKLPITAKMAKGFLDYSGISRDAWKWRFEQMYNENGDVHSDDMQTVLENTGLIPENIKPQFACEPLSPEQYFGFSWQTIEVVRDKVDEFLDDINNRKISAGIQSVPYKNLESSFSYLINSKMSTPESKASLEHAIFMSAVKGVGFLRPVLYDIETSKYIPTFGKKGLEDKSKWKETIVKDKAGVVIESVDPERVFVDTSAPNPKDLFIVTPLDPSEIVYRFPMLQNRIYEYMEDREKADVMLSEGVLLNKTRMFTYHAGEQIKEIYDAGSFFYDKYKNYFLRDRSLMPEGIVKSGYGNYIFSSHGGGRFWDNFLYQRMAEERKAEGYFLIEYFDVVKDIYVAYIDDTILYEGPIPYTYKGSPITPIKLNSRGEGFFSDPITEMFAPFQDQQTQINMKQRVTEIATGSNLMTIDTDQIDEMRHPGKQIELSVYAPIQQVHIKDTVSESGVRPPAIQPITFNNGSDNALNNRLVFLQTVLERQFPSLKQLIASNTKEGQTNIIYSRDAKTNSYLRNITNSLSNFGILLLHFILMEFRYFNSSLKDATVPLYEGSREQATIYIASTEDDLKRAKEGFETELDNLYKAQLNAFIDEMFNNADVVNPMFMQIKQQIENQVVGQILERSGMQPASQEDMQVKRDAILTDPANAQIVNEQVAKQAPDIIKSQLAEMGKQQIPRPQDTRIYLSFEDLNNYEKLVEAVKITFDKTLFERQQEMLGVLNAIQPIVNYTPFVMKYDEYVKEVLLANNQNPADWLQPKQPTGAKMVEQLNARTNYFFDLLKNPVVTAKYLNENLGQEVFSPEMLIQGLAMQEQAMTDIKIKEIQARGDVKTTTDVTKQTLLKEADFASERAKMDIQNQSMMNQQQ